MFQPLYARQLLPAERDTLQRNTRSTNREEATRASVILLSSEGKTAAEISEAIGFHSSNVKKWIRRFNIEGIDGIAIKKRGPQGGPKPKFTQEQINQIKQLARAYPPSLGYSYKQWTPQKLANVAVERGIVASISHVTIRQILKKESSIESEARAANQGPAARLEGVRAYISDEASFRSGEVALSHSRYEDAVTCFQTALLNSSGAPEEEAQIRVSLSKALEELSRYDDAFEAVSRYEDPRVLSSLSARTRARVRLRTGWVNSYLRNHPKAIASLNEAKRLFLELGDDLGMSEAHYALGRTYIELNEFRIARDHLVAAVSNQKTALDRDLLAQIYRRLGLVDFSEGAFSSSRENYLKALDLAEGSANANLIGGILLDIGTTLFAGTLGESQESARYLERGISYLEKGGHKDYLALAYNNLGDVLRYSGRWNEAVENLNKALDIAQKHSKPDHEATARITLAEIICASGKYSEAEMHLSLSLQLIEGSGDKWLEANALRILAAVYRGLGRMEGALKTLRQTMQISTSIGDLHGVALAMVGLAEVHISQGGYDQAREYLELAQGRLKEEMHLPLSGLIQRVTGELEAAFGRLAEAKQHIAQSISIFTTTGISYDLAKSYLQMGLLLKKARDLKGAESNLLQARDIFEQLGAEPDFEVTRKALASINQIEEGPQVLRVSPINDVLLMQRLIEASASRELLVQELAAVIYENFSIERVIICRVEANGRVETLAMQGINRNEADKLCASFDVSMDETISRITDGYLVKIGDNTRLQILVYIGARDSLDIGRLHPLLKQAELGLEACSLRAAARGAITRNYEQRIQTLMPGFIAASAPMFDVIDRIYKIRTSDVTVLITGESGTGKELVARYIHGQSARARAIFLPFNCTATPKDIIDSQLFGHRRGAFTGATANYPGIIKAADGGTLFLDEIGDLSLEVQPKLMRFLQEGEIQPLGETKPQRVDVRILAATNTDLERAVEDARFREDLFHRLNIIRIHVPPLRERREEVPVLAAHFLDHCSSRSGKQGITMAQEAIDALTEYDWPGNVRQLRNEIERVVAYAYEGSRVSAGDLSPEVVHPRRHLTSDRSRIGLDRSFGIAASGGFDSKMNGNHYKGESNGKPRVKLKEATAALEKDMIEDSLARNRNNLSRTAIDLGLSRRGLRLKLAQLGIQRD